ncbi:PQ-loop-domain-containing protein [Gymnopus androsaceus JB14]|uniref:PQ-loop-domain-containing protein n=1 Tax=Gymnopus androsaceus JB14 TaxID=1447944 RepID=A0A6A4HR75_9AGAR|nr:PQ-loop-domain-containing protein [Gymnopus androsaceus JB14]
MAEFNNTLSSILGWISIACWIVVYSPQIYENYSLQSGEGLSLAFIIIWLLGDLTNMTGAILAGLLPTMIILAAYYSVCSSILLFQFFYYRLRTRSRVSNHEETPLLAGQTPKVTPTKVLVLRYTGALLFVIATGILAWWISNNVEMEEKPPKRRSSSVTLISQILGWTSAICYLGSRVPQIIKNFTTRCEGLAPAMFFFTILGNATYSLSICVKSTEHSYLVTNASWLAGDALTIFLDFIVSSPIFGAGYT